MSFPIKQQKDWNVNAEVTASSNLTDNYIVRGDGGSKGVQTSLVSIDDSGNITGIGTLGCGAITSSGAITGTIFENAPLETFIFSGTTYSTKVFISKESDTDINSSHLHFSNNNTRADEPVLMLGRGRGTLASKLTVQDDDYLGELIFAGYNGTDWSLGARIVGQVNGTPGDGDMPASLLFQTAEDGSENPTTRVEIDSNGVTHFYGSLNAGAGQFVNITTVNAATYDLLTTDYILNVTYTSTGAVTSLTLPTAQCVLGRTIVIKDAGGGAGSNNITIDSVDNIDGAGTYVISSNYDSVTLYCDGTSWFVI